MQLLQFKRYKPLEYDISFGETLYVIVKILTMLAM